MAAFIYTYSDGDFQPDDISMFGYVFSRSTPTEVTGAIAAELDEHPHFKRVGRQPYVKPSLAVTHADADVSDKSGLLEASGIMTPEEIKKAKKANYMREYFARKKAAK